MEPAGTLLSHLAMRFAEHPEIIVTEALAFTLHRSAAARRSVVAGWSDAAREGPMVEAAT